MNQELWRLVLKQIDEESELISGRVLAGSCQTYDEYKKLVGYLAGLNFLKTAEQIVLEKLNKETD